MDFTPEEQFHNLIHNQPRGKTVICACGHTAKNHYVGGFVNDDGIKIERCGRGTCGCHMIVPAIIVSNANRFQKKYLGYGLDSAFSKALGLLLKDKGTYEKLPGYKCGKCHKTDCRLTATSTDWLDSLLPGKRFVHKPYFAPLTKDDLNISGGKYHLFLCNDCMYGDYNAS